MTSLMGHAYRNTRWSCRCIHQQVCRVCSDDSGEVSWTHAQSVTGYWRNDEVNSLCFQHKGIVSAMASLKKHVRISFWKGKKTSARWRHSGCKRKHRHRRRFRISAIQIKKNIWIGFHLRSVRRLVKAGWIRLLSGWAKENWRIGNTCKVFSDDYSRVSCPIRAHLQMRLSHLWCFSCWVNAPVSRYFKI